jgi:thiamine-monophosphate kinase
VTLREDDVVASLTEILDTGGRGVKLGIGDDAAVWQPSRSHRSVISTDMLVEGVHFTRATMTFEDVGWRVAAANLSDLAAMGARAVLATIALGVPHDVEIEQVLELYRGIAACARTASLAVVGGDLSRAPVLTIAMTAVGDVRASNCKTRSGGRDGDVVALTGPLGASRAGLDAARGAVQLEDSLRDRALRAHRRPQPRLQEGHWLGASASVRAMMDCSDGLSTDLMRLCASSGVGALLEDVPVAESAQAAALQLRERPRDYALAGGEDYELIVAVERRAFAHLARRFVRRFGKPLHRVGRLRAQHGLALLDGERELPVGRTGWDHFEPVLPRRNA